MGRSLVLSCEHASRLLPRSIPLGLAPGEGTGHHAWDEGAHELALGLAVELGAPLVAGQVSRLVVDLNRSRHLPAAIPAVAFGLAVPGNTALDERARRRRLRALHDPYRRSLRAEVRRAIRRRGDVVHLSVHAFTATLGDERRELDVGLLFDPARPREQAVADELSEALRAVGVDARENQPYLGTDDGGTTWLRTIFPDPAYAGLELELRDDLPPEVVDAVRRVVLRWATV
ncbi:MAG: N-formylglutamate amidohydrolase [Alphaproteobacteria bacterium]|nr:N-formylglutamate amidohydrolase [Alphaproteobacteria bacterium]